MMAGRVAMLGVSKMSDWEVEIPQNYLRLPI